MKALKKVLMDVKEKIKLIAKINGKKDRKTEKGFTLVELIAVVIILGILLVLVVPKILGSSTDANAKLIAKSVQDINYAVGVARMKCPSAIGGNIAGAGDDTKELIPALWSQQCGVLNTNSFEIDTGSNSVKVGAAGYSIVTDYNASTSPSTLKFTIDCKNDNDVCTKAYNQLTNMYGNGACGNAAPTNAKMTCTLAF